MGYNIFAINLIINTLPWTNADNQQLVGRLIRKGGRTDSVNIFVAKAKFIDQLSDKEFEYDVLIAGGGVTMDI